MKHFLIFFIILNLPLIAEAQARYIDRHGKITFFSSAPLEDIEAVNTQAVCVLDIDSGSIAVSMLMRAFDFPNSLMEEHFNENYVESHKFPKATFSGRASNPSQLLSKQNFIMDISGQVTIHGVTRPLSVKAQIDFKGESIIATAKFPLEVESFGIEVPKLMRNKIAEEVMVSVSFELVPLKI